MICDRYSERFEGRVALCARGGDFQEMGQSVVLVGLHGVWSNNSGTLASAPRVRVGRLRSELRGEREPDRRVQKLP